MTDPEDLVLIKNIKKNVDTERSLRLLTEKHSGIFYDKVNHFMRHPNFGNTSGLLKEDILNEKEFIIYSAAISFNEEKNVQFSTWLGNSTFYYLHSNYHNNKNEILVEELPDQTQEISDAPDKQEYLNRIKDYIHDLNDPRIEKLFNLRYFSSTNGKLATWKYIGKQLGLSLERCRQIHNEVIKELQESIK